MIVLKVIRLGEYTKFRKYNAHKQSQALDSNKLVRLSSLWLSIC